MTNKANHAPAHHATSVQLAFERVPVCGHEIEAVRLDDQVLVSVRRVCEVLGLTLPGQVIKLRAAPWSRERVTTIVTPDANGRNQESFCVDLECLPMWLATVDVGRVGKASAKALLVDYQIKAAAVLRDHFYGRMKPANDVDLDARIARTVALAVAEAVPAAVAAAMHQLGMRPQPAANDASCIGPAGAAKILGTLRAIAATKAGAIGQGGCARVKNRLRFLEERTLRRELSYPMDRGCSWRKLSEGQFGRAMLILERMTGEADDMARLAAREAGPLFRAVPRAG